jgi:long-chain acyl-CoA synthetase
MRTLPDLLFAAAQRYGPRPALAVRRGLRTQVWTYRGLVKAASGAAARLGAAGVRPGDRIMVLAPNSPELVASMFGVWMTGAILVPIDLQTPPDVIERLRERTEPRLLIGEPAGDGSLPTLSVSLLAQPIADGVAIPDPRRQPSDTAELVFTSGTTGLPKGVVLSHANITSNVQAALDAMSIPVGEHLLSLLPLSHMLEQTAGLLAPIAAGATIYYPTSRRSSAIVAALQRHAIGLLVCVPDVLRLLLAGIEREVERAGRTQRWETLLRVAGHLPMEWRPLVFRPVHERLGGHLRLVLCGGAALDPRLWQRWEALGVRVIQGYGATECAPIVTSNRLERRLADAVGWPVRGVEVRLATDGEVLVRGPNVTCGYWCDPRASEAAFSDGWYRTGDIGTFGSQGELRLLGRKKEMIVLANGQNVFPQDVEDVLRQAPAVHDCVVVGRPRPDGRAEVHAVIIPTGSVEEARVAARRANTRLTPHQQIGGVTIWPEADFPRTTSLKVKRGEVLARLAEPTLAPTNVAAPVGDSLADRVRGLVARAADRPLAGVQSGSDLVLDLGLDSLARIELAVLVEEELGRNLPDAEVTALHTVGELIGAVERGDAAEPNRPLPGWPRLRPIVEARLVVQDRLLFPALRLIYRPRIVAGALPPGRDVDGPVLLIANHTSHLDALTVLSLLPAERRRRTAVAAASDYFFTSPFRTIVASLALGAFPFNREGAVAESLAHCGDLVDAGYTILIFPEGTRSADGHLQPFRLGSGLLARELRIPVVPVRLEGLYAILPRGRSWPRPGRVRLLVGKPLSIEPGQSNSTAAELLSQSIVDLDP